MHKSKLVQLHKNFFEDSGHLGCGTASIGKQFLCSEGAGRHHLHQFKMKTARIFLILGSAYPLMQYHIPDDQILVILL